LSGSKEDAQSELVKRLQREPLPIAYALIQDPDDPGRTYDVRLRVVYAEAMEFLEPSGRPSRPSFARARLVDTMIQDGRKGARA
jgi:hypothetical protein